MRTNRGILVTGKSGMGKSWMIGYLLEAVRGPLVVLDVKDEHVGLADRHFRFDAAVLVKARDVGVASWWTHLLDRAPRVRFGFLGLDLDQQALVVDGLAKALHERGDTCFAASEYHRFAPNGRVPRNLMVLHTDARTVGIDWVVDAQRPALMDTTVASQANLRVGFGMDDENDLRRTAPYFGAHDGAPPRDALKGLRPRQCLIRDCNTGEQQLVQTTALRRRTTHHG